jgi:hypothetical protein
MPGMRIPKSMLRRLSAGILALVFLLTAALIPVLADTGTYGLSGYIVTLEPQTDGQVRITVEQQWKVLSGDIPWVTVGLPNDHFTVENYGGNVSKIAAANSGGFSGVRIDLDKDYKPGQSFAIKFSVMQGNLLERLTEENKWRISYTPGWYDRATIDRLQINLVSPVDYQTYSSVSPMPGSTNNNVITWERLNLAPGSRVNIVMESTDGSFLTAPAPAGATQSKGLGTTFYIIIGVILVVGLLVFWGIRKNRQARDNEMKKRVADLEAQMAEDKKKKQEVEEGFEEYVDKNKIQPDAQGRYYDRGYGDYITPAIWGAVIANQYNRQQNTVNNVPPSRPSCACVSCACACACACAGGGAAGCSRKSLHECRDCTKINPPETIQHGKIN